MIFLHVFHFTLIALAAAIQESPPTFGLFCGIPAPVYANGTKATNWTDYINSLETPLNPNGQGITDAWGNDGGPIPWPRTSAHKVVIPYCFTQEWDRKYIRNIIENGMAKWIEHLGGPASQESRHAIGFQERKDSQGKPLYCSHLNDRDAWNPNVPHDTVAFEYSDGKSWGASVGLTRNGKPWQQLVRIADGYTLFGALHEIGHVLGMAHEHNRSDRDTWVKIDFRLLADWPLCLARARAAEGLTVTPTEICNSIHRAIKYGCSCSSFVKNYVEPGWTIKSHGYYDLSSIMHYASVTGYSNAQCIEEGVDCPVKVYIDAENHDKGTALLEQARKPSHGDLMWVKQTYPWQEE